MDPTWRSRGYLPHCDGLSRQQFITYRLADSLPQAVLQRLDAECPGTDQDPERRARIEAYLDTGHGSCVLRNTACAAVVEDNLLHFDGERYRLIAWVVMPNHVHALIDLPPGTSLDAVVHSWKSYTAKHINRLIDGTGTLWQREYWDRYIRDMEHLQKTIAYIDHNPVAAGLVRSPMDWRFGSARRRLLLPGS
jgi:REP element-mobilizing transposase RayT